MDEAARSAVSGDDGDNPSATSLSNKRDVR